MVGYQLFLGAIVLLAIAAAFEPPSVIRFSGLTLAILVYLRFVSAAAFSLWYVPVKYNQLTKMAAYRFLIPVCGTLLSAAILDTESLGWPALVSLVFVSLGLVLTSGAMDRPATVALPALEALGPLARQPGKKGIEKRKQDRGKRLQLSAGCAQFLAPALESPTSSGVPVPNPLFPVFPIRHTYFEL